MSLSRCCVQVPSVQRLVVVSSVVVLARLTALCRFAPKVRVSASTGNCHV